MAVDGLTVKGRNKSVIRVGCSAREGAGALHSWKSAGTVTAHRVEGLIDGA